MTVRIWMNIKVTNFYNFKENLKKKKDIKTLFKFWTI